MNSIRVIITLEESRSSSLPTISISNELLKKLSIPTDLPLILRLSNQNIHIICRAHHTDDNHLIMPLNTAKQLHLAQHTRLHLSYNPNRRELRLGPVLAILVSQVSKEKPPFADLNQFSEELLQVAKKRHILAYVVSLAELAKDTPSVIGWSFDNKSWKKKSLPYPQVLYNRISSRKVEKNKAYKDLIKQLSKKAIPLFNQTFLNKWEVYQKLSSEPKMLPYLPKTTMFQTMQTFKAMLQSYPILFIKPIHGSMGRGIYRISRSWNGFYLQYSAAQGEQRKSFTQADKLYTFLKSRTRSKKYILQEGIPIVHLQERTVDFRILMQKDSSGKWAVTSSVARIGPANRFVSNIARGGEINKISATLKKCRLADPVKIKRRLLAVAKLACEIIDVHHQGQFGELGVDLAITRSGKIYLLELNSKPSKADNTLTLPSAKGRPSVHRLLDYTLFLTKHEQVEV